MSPELEADAGSILRRITPPLDPTRYKGQAGKIAVIGGCREYTGAPYFAAISALKIGADLSHVFCTKDAAPVIKSYSPELIVHPVLEESCSVRDDEKASVFYNVLAEATKWMERFDCLVVGPGLGRDPFLLGCVSEIMKCARQSNIPIVIDGDGLFLVTNNLDLISGYSLAVLTPNVNEYKRLVEKVLERNVDDQDAPEELLLLSRRIGGATILRKGNADLISDGKTVSMVSIFGSPRRCGGQGDILAGSVAVFSSWAHKQVSENVEGLNSRFHELLLYIHCWRFASSCRWYQSLHGFLFLGCAMKFTKSNGLGVHSWLSIAPESCISGVCKQETGNPHHRYY